MSKITEALGKKIGPLPAGAWAVALLGGVGVAVAVRRRAVDAPAEPDYSGYDPTTPYTNGGNTRTPPGMGNPNTGEPADDADDYDGPPPWSDDLVNGIRDGFEDIGDRLTEIDDRLNNPPAAPTPGAPSRPPRPRGTWRQRVTATLVAEGYRPHTIDRALDKYAAGKHLNTAQTAVIGEAIARVGAPPKPPATKPNHGERKPPKKRDEPKPAERRRDTGRDRRR